MGASEPQHYRSEGIPFYQKMGEAGGGKQTLKEIYFFKNI